MPHTARVPQADTEMLAGTMVGGGRFAITAVLGEGAQARTLQAIDKTNGRLVALKQFSIRGAREWKDVELAEREARVLASLDHELLPRYVSHFEEDGSLYLALELVEGRTLAQLQESGQMSQRCVVAFLRDAAQTLDYLHGRAPPIVHRDIKPSNVIRRPDGRFVLVDFGSVSHRLEPGGGSTVVGTFGFMAPEQFQGRAMPASDVYSVGATAITLLTGHDPEKLPHAGLGIDVAAALGPDGDPRLQALLCRALDPNPDVRTGTSLSRLMSDSGLDSDEPPRSTAGRANAWVDDRHSSNPPKGARAGSEPPSRGRRTHRRDHSTHSYTPPPFRRQPHGHWIGKPLIMMIAMIGLLIARVSTSAVMLVVLPLLLSMLSLVFGAGLRRAAHACRRAGLEAQRTLRRTTKQLRDATRNARTRRSDERSSANETHGESPGKRGRANDNPASRWRVSESEKQRGQSDDADVERLIEERLERAAREFERRFGKRDS